MNDPVLKTDRDWLIWYAWYGGRHGGVSEWMCWVRPTFSRGLTKKAAIRRANRRLKEVA